MQLTIHSATGDHRFTVDVARTPTQQEADAVVQHLALIMRMGLLGYRSRTWAAALLVDLRRRHEGAIADVDKTAIVEALAGRYAEDDVTLTLIRLAVTEQVLEASGKYMLGTAAESRPGRRT